MCQFRSVRGFHEKLVSLGLNVGDKIETIQRRSGGVALIAKEGEKNEKNFSLRSNLPD